MYAKIIKKNGLSVNVDHRLHRAEIVFKLLKSNYII